MEYHNKVFNYQQKFVDNANLVAYSIHKALPEEIILEIYKYLSVPEVFKLQSPLVSYGFQDFLKTEYKVNIGGIKRCLTSSEASEFKEIFATEEMPEFFLLYKITPSTQDFIHAAHDEWERKKEYQEKYEAGYKFQLGICAGTIAVPVINYLDDMLTKENSEKPLSEYFYSHAIKTATVLANSHLVSYELFLSNAPMASKVILSNALIDFATNEFELSTQYAFSMLGKVAYSFASLAITNSNKQFIDKNPMTSGFLMQIAPSVISLAYHSCEKGIDFVYQNSLDLLGYSSNSLDGEVLS